MKSESFRKTTGTLQLAAATAGLVLATSPAFAEVINIGNAGFEDVSGSRTRGNWTDMADWTQEIADKVYVDDNGTTWVPEASRTLYFGPGAVHQDLNHNWSSSDTFTLGLIAMNPSWVDNNNTFKIQLRQASDDTVLWDSGPQNVGGTVTTTAPPTYTGTGHIFSWSIDASTFTAGTEGEPINIRIAHVSGGPVYLDNVSLGVIGGGGPVDYTSWQVVNGAGGQGLDEDHDLDGVGNGVEYFIGGPNGNTTGFTATPGVTDTAGTLSVTWTHAADYTGVYGTDFTVETSPDLQEPWTTETVGVNVTVSGDDVTYTFPAGTKNFARLRVTGP